MADLNSFDEVARPFGSKKERVELLGSFPVGRSMSLTLSEYQQSAYLTWGFALELRPTRGNGAVVWMWLLDSDPTAEWLVGCILDDDGGELVCHEEPWSFLWLKGRIGMAKLGSMSLQLPRAIWVSVAEKIRSALEEERDRLSGSVGLL